ncbi:unnamed protein product, partial [Mesorhabditis belari]|uniref:Uncharacterized protein n=1 Tax=Mesorhabditis belari TaxID=2138241 RepID=A0AAF3ECD6_9BILA
MDTPNGRFEPGERLCVEACDAQWSAAWTTRSFMTAFHAFMNSEKPGDGVILSPPSDEKKRRLASESHYFNSQNELFVQHFPQLLRSNPGVE